MTCHYHLRSGSLFFVLIKWSHENWHSFLDGTKTPVHNAELFRTLRLMSPNKSHLIACVRLRPFPKLKSDVERKKQRKGFIGGTRSIKKGFLFFFPLRKFVKRKKAAANVDSFFLSLWFSSAREISKWVFSLSLSPKPQALWFPLPGQSNTRKRNCLDTRARAHFIPLVLFQTVDMFPTAAATFARPYQSCPIRSGFSVKHKEKRSKRVPAAL